MSDNINNEKVFKIIGFGEIRISESSNWLCGEAEGFSFQFKPNRQNYFIGGVLDKEEARLLADHIYKSLYFHKNER